MTALKTVLANLDEAIIGLLRERERIVSTVYDRKLGSYTSAPFTIPFAVAEYKNVVPYEVLAPSLWLGFEQEASTAVQIRQSPIVKQEDNVPDHFYSVDIRVADNFRSKWLTVEREVLLPPGANSFILNLAMKAKSTNPISVNIEISIPLENGGERRVPVSQRTINADYEPIFSSSPFSLTLGDRIDDSNPAKLLMFLPCNLGYELSLAYMYVLASTPK